MPMMHQSHVSNVSFSNPNANTALGFSSQVGCRETDIQENSNAKNGCVYSETGWGGHNCQKPASEEMADIGQSEENEDL